MGIVILVIVLAMVVILGRFAISEGQALERRKRSLQLKHDRHYNSLDPNSKYSERECCGTECGCHSNKKKLTKGPSGIEENWSSGDM